MSPAPTITIIDDDAEVRAATESLIQSCGFEARTFASAEDFLKSAFIEQTACIITDVQMPGMSGIELQQNLLKSGHDVPVIFLTAFPEAHVRRQALALGAAGFFGKPFEAAALLSCVETALKST